MNHHHRDLRRVARMCAFCKMGPVDGTAIFQRPGDQRWACARHARFLKGDQPITEFGQRIIEGLADGSIPAGDSERHGWEIVAPVASSTPTVH